MITPHAAQFDSQGAFLPDEFDPAMTLTDDLKAVTLRDHVERVVRDYFEALDGEVPSDVYELILQEIELPLLTVVLEKTRGNQSKSAQILGLNRGTLRKKLKKYHLMA